MIYYLGIYLQEAAEALSFLRLVDSISFRALCGAITSLIITILCGGRAILYFYGRGHRDMPRDYLNFEAASNQAKTYGGGLIVAAILISIGLWCKLHSLFVLFCAGAIVWFAALGWIDDFLKVRYRSSDRGLSEKAKLALQVPLAPRLAPRISPKPSQRIRPTWRPSSICPFSKIRSSTFRGAMCLLSPSR